MNSRASFGLLLAIFASIARGAPRSAVDGKSQWVYPDVSGKLVYHPLPSGDRIMDFSYAGYGGGGVAIPDVPVKKSVSPSGGDDTAAVQGAIDEVSKIQLSGEFRGAVLLSPGVFNCSATLTLKTSGVILRGSGSSGGGTTIRMTGKPHLCASVGGNKKVEPQGKETPFADSFVPSGSMSVRVRSAAGFHASDTILVVRPVTDAWLKFMGMDILVRNGKREQWISGRLETERTIAAINGDRITLSIPLTDNFDAAYLNPPGGSIVKATITGTISHVGVESFRVESPPQAIEITDPQNRAISVDDAMDSWVRDLEIVDTINSTGVGKGSSRITFQRVNITHTVATKGAAKPGDYGTDGSQILFDRCSGNGDNLFYFASGARAMGPNVLLNCKFQGHGWIQPHARWATGLLVDGCQVPQGGIDFMNRGIMGSGHGWTVGWAVAWNCTARTFLIQKPPGAMNWAIGCQGQQTTGSTPGGSDAKLPEGIIDSPGVFVAPQSLYLEQLRQRLGPVAVKNIGY